MTPDEFFREINRYLSGSSSAFFRSPDSIEVMVSEVCPDESRGDQGVEGMVGRSLVKFTEYRNIKTQAIVSDPQRIPSQKLESIFNLHRAEAEGLLGQPVHSADTMYLRGLIEEAVGFDVEKKGRSFRSRNPAPVVRVELAILEGH
jgi:hypothetical protein